MGFYFWVVCKACRGCSRISHYFLAALGFLLDLEGTTDDVEILIGSVEALLDIFNRVLLSDMQITYFK